MADRRFMEELLARLRQRHADASFTVGGDGLTWHDDDAGVVTLITSEDELSHAMRSTGRDARDDLWPGSTIEEAGLKLLLVHLDEVVATRDVTDPLRVTRDGLIWPDSPRPRPGDRLDPDGGPYSWSAERSGGS